MRYYHLLRVFFGARLLQGPCPSGGHPAPMQGSHRKSTGNPFLQHGQRPAFDVEGLAVCVGGGGGGVLGAGSATPGGCRFLCLATGRVISSAISLLLGMRAGNSREIYYT